MNHFTEANKPKTKLSTLLPKLMSGDLRVPLGK